MYNRQAYAEVDDFLEYLDDEFRNEIPLGLRRFFKENRDNSHHIYNLETNLQSLREETLSIIAFLNLKYWCKDEKEKRRLEKIYALNEEQYQNELKEKYNSNNLFNNISNNNIINEQNPKQDSEASNKLIVHKENKFRNFINKLKKLFKR